MSNSYEEKLAARRARLQARADRREAEAEAQRRRSDDLAACIPLGQPILVGHHSERRHRRDLKKIQDSAFRAVDRQREAARLRRQAESVGRAGISSDDPAAIEKLEAKLAALEDGREAMKAANRAYKRGGWEAVEGILPDAQVNKLRSQMERVPYIDRPFPSYSLSNAGAEIRRVRKRIEALRARAAAPESAPIEGDGFRVEEDRDDNRLRIYFDAKPDEELRRRLKSRGFRWARSVGAWQRQLTDNARHDAKWILGVAG